MAVENQWQSEAPVTPRGKQTSLEMECPSTPPPRHRFETRKMAVENQWQSPPVTPRPKQTSFEMDCPSTPPPRHVFDEDPLCTPRGVKKAGESQLQVDSPLSPRCGRSSFDAACPSTPPPLFSRVPRERTVTEEIRDAINMKSMPDLAFALMQEELNTGSLIHACIQGGHLSALQFILEQGMRTDIDKPSPRNGKCPLEFAFYASRSDDTIKMLLEHGADPNITSTVGRGQTLLHKAAAANNLSAVSLLLQYGANPSQVDNDSCTPLHSASKIAGVFRIPDPLYLAIIEALLSYGADPMLRDTAGCLAQDYAPWACHLLTANSQI